MFVPYILNKAFIKKKKNSENLFNIIIRVISLSQFLFDSNELWRWFYNKVQLTVVILLINIFSHYLYIYTFNN